MVSAAPEERWGDGIVRKLFPEVGKLFTVARSRAGVPAGAVPQLSLLLGQGTLERRGDMSLRHSCWARGRPCFGEQVEQTPFRSPLWTSLP